jgi:S-formylglutathione hydrolase FrmB
MKNMAKGARLTSNRALTKRFGFKIFNKTLIPRLIIFVAIVAISGAATGCSLIPSSLSLPSETQAVLSGSGITFSNGYGITVLSQTVKGREIDLEVTTTAVQGTHEIIILLPESYYSNPTARYPVLYLLNGALAGPSQWVTSGGMAGAITDPYNLITVIPDGGLKGWYVNWNNCATICPQNWQTFHLDQLVPWIDANLRTIPDRSARAIAGLSMGGYGAVHYAEVAPNLFSYVASFSGALDTGNFTTEVTINAEEAGLVPGSGTPVPPGSIFGNNYIADSDVNPANIANLKNTFVALYVGQGDATGPGIVEAAVYQQNQLMAYNMAQAGIHYWYSEDHEPSQAFGWGCDGDHDINCWNAYLANALPTMMAHLTPATNVSPPLPPPDTNVVVNPGFESGMAPWTCSGSCGVDIGLGNAHSGNNNGWVRNSFGWNDIEQTVSVVPDTTYTLTGWIRTSSNNTAGYFGLRDLQGNVIGQTQYGSLPNYTQLSVTINVGPVNKVVLFAGLWAVNGDTWAQVDDVSLSPN